MFSDSISICDLASKSKVQIKLGKRCWLNQQIEYLLFPLLKSIQGTVDFWGYVRRIFGRRNKNVNSIPLVLMRAIMVQQQEHSFCGLN